MRRLIWGFAGLTYHIVGNLMSRLNHIYVNKQVRDFLKISRFNLFDQQNWSGFWTFIVNQISLNLEGLIMTEVATSKDRAEYRNKHQSKEI